MLILTNQNLYVSSVKRGINGISWKYRWPFQSLDTTLVLDAAEYIDVAQSESVDNWLIAWAGTNGMAIGGHSAAQEYSDLQEYIQDRILAGWSPSNIIVPTMLPRDGFSEVTRSEYNSLIINDSENLGYTVARIDLDDDIGGSGDDLNTTYFYDGVHLTDTGHSKVSQIIYSLIFP